MTVLVAGLILFFAVHSVSIVNDGWRNRMVERMGLRPWKMLYGAIALIGLLLIIWGYGLARADPTLVYTPPLWLRNVSILLLVPVFPLLLATYLPGRIQAMTRHPMLLAVILWALAHLLANGRLADVLLFGIFLVWAIADRVSLNRRTPHPVPAASASRLNDLIAVVAGLALYVWFLFGLHQWLIGVPAVAH
ncbi:MAG: NnrU family protein [Thiogranum sp.]|nr:NnrU family protein [Thiogranum sp.]